MTRRLSAIALNSYTTCRISSIKYLVLLRCPPYGTNKPQSIHAQEAICSLPFCLAIFIVFLQSTVSNFDRNNLKKNHVTKKCISPIYYLYAFNLAEAYICITVLYYQWDLSAVAFTSFIKSSLYKMLLNIEIALVNGS